MALKPVVLALTRSGEATAHRVAAVLNAQVHGRAGRVASADAFFENALDHARDLFAAGVRRVNVSLDTLDEAKFAEVTRWGRLPQVMRGIQAAKAAGLRVKINAVALKDFNEDELHQLTDWCATENLDLTFIEVMPMGDIGNEDRIGQYWSLKDLRAQLETRSSLTDLPERTGGPARYVKVKETGGRVGFITPMTHNFCESCNRVRLTCTGTLYMCLGQDDAADLREPLRASEDPAVIGAAIDEAIGRKPKGHDFIIDRRSNKPSVSRHMSVTGG